MKVISIRQPWASLVVTGYKKIETRGWNTKYRGELIIHAGLAKDKVSIELYNSWKSSHLYDSIFRYVAFNDLPLGAIIGKVTLVDVARTEELNYNQSIGDGCGTDWCIHEEFGCEKELAFGDYSPNRYGWLLANPVLFDKPIPCKGQLGLWNIDIEK